MKGRFVLAVIFLLVLCLTLCSCSVSFPLKNVEIVNKHHQTFVIYVSGAVEHDGYFEISSGASYALLFELAGILSQTVLPLYYTGTIDGSVTQFLFSYYDGERAHDSINANSPLIAARRPIDGLTDTVIDKLATYVEQHGAIRNRQHLELALGDDYADNYYKFFIAEKDYEKAD